MNVQNGVQFVKSVLGRGRYSFTLADAAEATGRRGQTLNMLLQRLKRDGWVVPLSRGFYLALDAQHQPAGILDPHWFVDDWARFLAVDYYVGGLSAAALHGAAHQHPVSFQVFANRRIRPITQSGLRIDVYYKKVIPAPFVDQHKATAGYFRASGPELTAYDILANRRCCPSLNHAATVFVELGEAIDPIRLAGLARLGGRISPLQRIGWLLDRTGWKEKTDALHEALKQRRLTWRPLEGRSLSQGDRNDRWQILINTDIQPDIER